MAFSDKLTGLYKKHEGEIRKMLRFCVVGAVNTAVDFAVYALVIRLVPWKYNHLLGQALGFAAGTLNAYFMNGGWVFRDKGGERKKGKKVLLRTFAGYAVTFLLSEGLLMLWVDGLGMNKYLAKLINLCVTVPLNYVINRLWTFREEKTGE